MTSARVGIECRWQRAGGGSDVEDSDATGINGDGSNNLAEDSGAVYVFRFDGADWAQQAYIKSSNSKPVTCSARRSISATMAVRWLWAR